MALFRKVDGKLEEVPTTTFAAEGVLERRGIQSLLREDISPLGEDLLVIAEEFCDWEESSRRIDLLCIDTQARLVVVEIKRTEAGGHMELQAIRYAAMVSSMTLQRAVAVFRSFLGGDNTEESARQALLEFLELEALDQVKMTNQVRIVLVSANFSAELTTSVLWLNKQGLDITCIRLRPYRLGDELLLETSQIIPLPEAKDYEVKVREQAEEVEKGRSAREEMFQRFWTQFIDHAKGQTDLFDSRSPRRGSSIGASLGRSGIWLTVALTEHKSRVQCTIGMGRKAAAAFRKLLAQREHIEAVFGDKLEWEESPRGNRCLIMFVIEGGWHLPEESWPPFQDKLIGALLRLEKAVKTPVLELKL